MSIELLPKTLTELKIGINDIVKKFLFKQINKQLLLVIRNRIIDYLYPFVYRGFLERHELYDIECDLDYRRDCIDGVWIKVINDPTKIVVSGLEYVTKDLIKNGAITNE